MVMIGNTFAGLLLHVGPVQSHHIMGLCDYAWHPDVEDMKSGHRWRLDEAPYHCQCPALEADIGEEWGREQSPQNNINAEFSRTSGSSGRAYAWYEGPFKDGRDSALEPCNGRGGTPDGAFCWKAPFLALAQVVHPDGTQSVNDEKWPLFRNVLLHPEWNCARYGTRLAKTMAWFATLLTQALFLQSVRSPQPLHFVFWRNSKAVTSLVATIVVALLAIYLPVGNDALRLAPLPLKSLLLACMGPIGLLGLTEASKMALQQKEDSAELIHDAMCL